LELGAPRLAMLAMASRNAARVALLGTLRRDGSPRISPIEPYLVEGQLLIGAMAWSQRAADLRRDPRYVLHSAITGPTAVRESLSSTARPSRQPRSFAAQRPKRGGRAGCPTRPSCSRCTLIGRVFVGWDTEQGVMTVDRWSSQDGYSQSHRTYP